MRELVWYPRIGYHVSEQRREQHGDSVAAALSASVTSPSVGGAPSHASVAPTATSHAAAGLLGPLLLYEIEGPVKTHANRPNACIFRPSWTSAPAEWDSRRADRAVFSEMVSSG